MVNRIFICTHSQLPKGDANSNYIFHMALSLRLEKCKVIAIGRSKDTYRQVCDIDGIQCINLERKANVPAKVEGHLFYGKRVVDELLSMEICEDDYVIIYGGYVSLFKAIASKLKFLKKGHVITSVVEWPTKAQFKGGIFNPDYLLWRYVFYRMIPYWRKVITISSNLDKHFKKIGCCTFQLPPMIDYKGRAAGNKKSSSIIQFIYAGADTQKDAIGNMLASIAELPAEKRKQIEFHITSLAEEKARSILGDKKWILEKYSDIIKIHGWMEYKDLMYLYYSTDFLLLARETNQFTLSNFPSKVPEMMNYGIIPVCSKVGDYTELYLHNMVDSVIFDGASPKECAKAISQTIDLSAEERHRLSLNAMNTAKQRFDYRVWGKSLVDFLQG